MLETFLTSSESDQYSSTPKKISKFPLTYMTGYFCRSVYFSKRNFEHRNDKLYFMSDVHKLAHYYIAALYETFKMRYSL